MSNTTTPNAETFTHRFTNPETEIEHTVTFNVHDEHKMQIICGCDEILIVISEAQLRLCAIMRTVELQPLHNRTTRLLVELVKCLRANSTHYLSSWKAGFIIKNHISAIVEKITSDVLLDSTYFGATQSETLRFLN